jgi:hypothetical protein
MAAALALLCGATGAGAQEPSDPPAVQSAYQSSLTEQAALALGGGGGEGLTAPMGAGDALAVNLSRTLQVIRQVQRGCRSYCFGEKMDQKAWQQALALQTAGAEGSSAAALNLSETIQTIEQIQHGCRIFCYGVTMSQSAWQAAGTVQDADARATADGGAALAANLSLTVQMIKQIQKACAKHCFGIELSQTAWQGAVTAQNGLAVADGGTATGGEVSLLGTDAAVEGDAELVPLATVVENMSGTLQALEQIQSDCRRFCFYGMSLSDAEWYAKTGLLPGDVDPDEALLTAEDEEGDAPAEGDGEPTAALAGDTPAEDGAETGSGDEPSLLLDPPAPNAEVVNDATTEQSLEQLQR